MTLYLIELLTGFREGARGFKVSLSAHHKIDLCFQRLLFQIVFLFAHKIENEARGIFKLAFRFPVLYLSHGIRQAL